MGYADKANSCRTDLHVEGSPVVKEHIRWERTCLNSSLAEGSESPGEEERAIKISFVLSSDLNHTG